MPPSWWPIQSVATYPVIVLYMDAEMLVVTKLCTKSDDFHWFLNGVIYPNFFFKGGGGILYTKISKNYSKYKLNWGGGGVGSASYIILFHVDSKFLK